MRTGSFGKLTQDKENTTQVTFHYVEGHAETFTIPMPAQEFQACTRIPRGSAAFVKPTLVDFPFSRSNGFYLHCPVGKIRSKTSDSRTARSRNIL